MDKDFYLAERYNILRNDEHYKTLKGNPLPSFKKKFMSLINSAYSARFWLRMKDISFQLRIQPLRIFTSYRSCRSIQLDLLEDQQLQEGTREPAAYQNLLIGSCKDLLSTYLYSKPTIIYRRSQTLKDVLAPSYLELQHMGNNPTAFLGTEGALRCAHNKCMCCKLIPMKKKEVVSRVTGDIHIIKGRLSCKSNYVVYVLECPCGLQYVGRATQKSRERINKHLFNIRHKIMYHITMIVTQRC